MESCISGSARRPAGGAGRRRARPARRRPSTDRQNSLCTYKGGLAHTCPNYTSQFSVPQIIGDTNYWRYDGGDVVDVDVADHAQAHALYMLYFQATTTIIVHVGLNSERDTEDVRSRKVYTTPLARAKGKTFFQCCLLLHARSKLHAEQDYALYT